MPRKPIYTQEERMQHARDYQRKYRAANPEKVKRWRNKSILNAARRLMAEAEKEGAEA